jgi:RNA polymerase sigma-B factor
MATSNQASRRVSEELRLFRDYRRTGDVELRNRIVARMMPLARHLAGRYPSHGEREDLVQVAAIGLIKAVDRFDPERGAAFSSFATPTILGELRRYFRDTGWAMRVPRELQELSLRVERVADRRAIELGRTPTVTDLARVLGASDEDVVEALMAADGRHAAPLDLLPDDARQIGAADDGFTGVEANDWFKAQLRRLPCLESRVLDLRLRHDLLQREIAELLGVSQMQVSRVLRRAIARLQQPDT